MNIKRNTIGALLALVLLYTTTYLLTADKIWFIPYILNYGIFAIGTILILAIGSSPEVLTEVLNVVKIYRSEMQVIHWIYFILFLVVLYILFSILEK